MIPYFLIIACFVVSGCESVINNHGYNSDHADITFIKPNHTTAEDVQSVLGSPTIVTPHALQNPKWHTWVYISKKTSTTSFFKPVVLSQQSLMIVMDDQGIVRDVKQVQNDSPEDLEPHPEQTEISTYEENVSKGIFGSFGRQLNNSPKKKS